MKTTCSMPMPKRKNSQLRLDSVPQCGRGALVLLGLLLALGAGRATAGPQYFQYAAGSRTAWNGNYWATNSGTGYTNAWGANDDAVFELTGGVVNLGANESANTLTFAQPGYSLTNSSFTITFGNPASYYPGMFATNGALVTNNCILANSGTGAGDGVTIQVNGTNAPAGPGALTSGLWNGTNVLTGNFANLTANSRGLSVNAGGLYLQTATTALVGPAAGLTISNGANFTYDCSGTVNLGVTAAATVRGNGVFTKRGAGTLVFGAGGQTITMAMGPGSLVDVEAGQLTGSSGYHGLWSGNQSSMYIAAGATTDFVEAGVNGATTIQLDGLNGAGALRAGYSTLTKTLILGVAGGGGTFNGPLSEDAGTQLAVIKTNAGVQVLNGTNYFRYGLTVAGGTLILTTNTYLSNGAITVSSTNGLTTTSILTIGGGINTGAANYNAISRVSAGGVLNYTNNGVWNEGSTGANYWYVGNGLGTGVVNQTTGTINFAVGGSSTTYLLIGNGGVGNWGIYNLLGGTLTSVGQIMMGVNVGASSILNVSNATLTAYNGLAIGRYDSASATTTNTVNQFGGTVNVSTLYMSGNATAASVISTLNITNGTFTATNFTALAAGPGDIATIYLGTNSFITLPVFPATRGAGAAAYLTLDGATLTPSAPSLTFLQNMSSASLSPKGVTFNVPFGNDITVAQALQDVSANGKLTKQGLGNLTLGGANTYSGTTTVSNGTLTVNGSLVNGAVSVTYGTTLYANGVVGGTVAVAGGATLGGVGTVNGDVTVASAATVSPGAAAGAYGTLTANNNLTFAAGSGLAMDINTDPVLTTSDLLQVNNGTLLASGPMAVYFNFPSGAPALGVPYTIMTNVSGTIDGAFVGNLIVGTHLYGGSFAQVGNTVTVTFTAGAGLNQLTWRGDGSANLWEVGQVQNWTNASGTASYFYLGDNVTLDDTSTNQVVTTFGAVAPASVTASSSKNYFLTGTGKITGSTGLTQAGSGSLTLGTANDYTGNTLISGGTLIFTNNGTVGGPITDNAQLTFNRTDTSTLTNLVAGSGSVNFIGSGQVTLAVSNSYNGPTVITNTRVYPQNANSFGANTATILITNNGGIYATVPVGFVQPLVLSGAGYAAGGTLRAGGSTTVTEGGPITLAAAATIAVDSGATLNLTNAAGISGTNSVLTLSYTGSGTVSGPVSLGAVNLSKQGTGTAILASVSNAWTGGTLIGAGTLQIGDGALNMDGSFGTGPITNNGTFAFTSATNFIINDNITGTGALTVNGSGSVTLNNITTNGAVNVNGAAGVTSVLNLQGPFFTGTSTFAVGNSANNATGVVNQTTGRVIVGGNQVLLGNGGPALTTYGQYNLYGGSLYATGNAFGLILGVNSFDTGMFNLTNGTLRVNNLEVARSSAAVTNSTGIYLQTGGSAVVYTNLSLGGSSTTNDPNATATFTINSSMAPATFVASNFPYLGVGNNSSVNMTLGLGAQVTLPAFPTTRGSGATVNLTLDGCTLTPLTSSANYISALGTAIITVNGATLNVPTNLAVTIPQAFLYDAAGDSCALNIQGGGNVTLTGANLYGSFGGLTLVTNAGLYLGGASGSIAGPVYVAGGATFGGNGSIVDGTGFLSAQGTLEVASNAILDPGTSATPGTLNISTQCTLDQGAMVNLDLSNVTTPASNDLVNVTGTLVATGPVTVKFNFWPMPALNQPYTIFSAGTLDGAFLGNLVAAPSDYPPTFAQVGNTITVTFSDGPLNHLVWQGDGITNTWALGLAGQWTNGVGPCLYKDMDQTFFNDTTANYTVNLVGTNQPGSVNVNATGTYTLQGPGAIAGFTAVNKSGSGTLYLNSTNSYSGGNTLNPNSGSVVGFTYSTNNALSIGSGPCSIGSGSILQINDTITYGSATTYIGDAITGTGLYRINFSAGTSARNTYITNLLGFNGTIELANTGSVADKWTITQVGAYGANLVIDNGSQLFDAVAGTISFPQITVVGAGNSEARGAMRISSATTVLAGPIALLGNTTIGFEFAGATLSGTITNATSLPITLTDGTGNSSGAGTFSGVLGNGTAGGTLAFAKTGTGTNLLSAANTFSGPTTISQGVLQLNNGNALQNSLATVNVNNGLFFGAGFTPFLLGGLAGTGNVALQDTAGAPINVTIGNNNSSGTVSGVLSGNAGSSLLKIGSGAESFTGVNTFAGSIEVANGVLNLATNNNTTNILVDAAGTLGANGTNNAVITVNGTFAPGGLGTAGTLVLTNPLNLSNSVMQVDLSSGAPAVVGSGTNDLILLNGVNGNLALNGQVGVAINVLGGTPVLNQPYTLIQFAGSIVGAGGGFYLTNTYYQGYFTTNFGAPSTITFTFTSAPASRNLVWQGDGVANDWAASVLGWTNAAGPAILDFYENPDAVSFNDTATNFNVTLPGAVYPASVTVIASNSYNLGGPGSINGATTLLKDGAGMLTVNNANNFTGAATVQGGTLVTGNALALGPTNSPIIVTNNGSGLSGTLDVAGQNLGLKSVVVSGAGVAGAGAIINNVGATAQIQALQSVTMTGNTTFGGTNRWDIRNPNYANGPAGNLSGGYNLTKVGVNQISLVGLVIDPTLGNLDIQQGMISYEVTTTGLGDPTKMLTVENGAILQLYNATNQLNKNITLTGGLIRDGAGANTNLGPITLTSGSLLTNTIDTSGGNLYLFGPVIGSGSLFKINGNTLVLTTNNTFTGPLTISGGTVQIDTNGTLGALATSLVTNNGVLNFQRSDALASYGGLITGSGSLLNNGSGTLTLSGVNSYFGGSTLTAGSTTVAGANNALGSGLLTLGDISGNVATLNLNGYSQTVSNLAFKNILGTNWVSLPAGSVLLVSNGVAGNAVNVGNFSASVPNLITQTVSVVGAGTLAVGAPLGTFSVEMSATNLINNGLLNLSGLSNFTASVSTFNAGTVGTTGGANLPFQLTVLLAQTNSITATNMVLSTSGTGYAFAPNANALYLGQNNTLNVSNLFVGGGRNTLLMAFTNLANPQLTLGGVAGPGSRANVSIGDNIDYGGGSSTANGTLDVSAGTFTGMLDNVVLGYGGNGVSATTRAFATGTLILGNSANNLNVNNLTLGRAAYVAGVTATNYTAAGTLIMSNGTLRVNSAMVLGQNDQTNGTYGQRESGSFTLLGGTATAPGIILGMHTALPADVSYATGLVAVVGGMLSVSSDITNGSGNTYGSLTLAGGTLNLNGNKIGSATRAVDVVSLQSGTLQSLGELNSGGQLTKTGSGSLTLAGVHTYSGATVVSNGTLLVNGTIAAGPVTAAAGTLGGTGTINGPVGIAPGGTLAPGLSGGIASLTINNTLTNSGNLLFKLNKALAPQSNDVVIVTGAMSNLGAGTLTVSNLGPNLAAGDTFYLFNAALPGGNTLTIVPPTNGVTFANNLASNGSIQVLTVPMTMASNPTNITFSVTGNTLTLAWPADHLGWYAQSNSVSLANPAAWYDVPGSQLETNLILNLDPTQTNVFYRLSSSP